jgi:CheY-like chemotaxis protein
MVDTMLVRFDGEQTSSIQEVLVPPCPPSVPCVVVCDESRVFMAASAALRAQPRIQHVLMLCKMDSATNLLALDGLSVGFVPKPLISSELVSHLTEHEAPGPALTSPPIAGAEHWPDAPGDVSVLGAHPRSPQSRAKLLVAEDFEVNQMLIRALAGKLGLALDIVDNGALAVAAIERHPDQYAAILMDLQMPIMDGLEATRLIRAHERRHSVDPIPIIALTASAQKEDQERCFAVGMDSFVSKPIRIRELRAALEAARVRLKF